MGPRLFPGDLSGADAAKAAICTDGLGFSARPAAAGHAIIYPPYPVSISRAMSAVKVSSMIAINHGGTESRGPTRQVRATLAAHGERLLGDR